MVGPVIEPRSSGQPTTEIRDTERPTWRMGLVCTEVDEGVAASRITCVRTGQSDHKGAASDSPSRTIDVIVGSENR
jgi:hypothetical protein